MKEKRQSEASKLLPVRRECRFTSVSLSLSGRLELTGQRWRYYSESPSLSRSNRAIRLYIYYVQLQKKDGRILEAFRDLLQFPLRDGRTDRVASKLFLFSPKNDSDRAVLRVFIGIKRILASMRRKPKGSPWSYVATVHYTTATFSRQKRRPPSNSSYRIYIVVSSRCVFVFAGCCSVSFSW